MYPDSDTHPKLSTPRPGNSTHWTNVTILAHATTALASAINALIALLRYVG